MKKVLVGLVLLLTVTVAILAWPAAKPTPIWDEVPIAALVTGPPVTPTRLNRALKIARGYWSEKCGTIRLRSRPLAKVLTIAQASWYRDSKGRYFNCAITYNSRHKRLPFDYYCAAMVHEVGHLSGRRHNFTDPSNVMYPRLSNLNVPSACKLPRDSRLVQ